MRGGPPLRSGRSPAALLPRRGRTPAAALRDAERLLEEEVAPARAGAPRPRGRAAAGGAASAWAPQVAEQEAAWALAQLERAVGAGTRGGAGDGGPAGAARAVSGEPVDAGGRDSYAGAGERIKLQAEALPASSRSVFLAGSHRQPPPDSNLPALRVHASRDSGFGRAGRRPPGREVLADDVRQRIQEPRPLVERGCALVLGDARLGGHLAVVPVQLRKRLDVVAGERDRNHQQVLLAARAEPPDDLLGVGPSQRTGPTSDW